MPKSILRILLKVFNGSCLESFSPVSGSMLTTTHLLHSLLYSNSTKLPILKDKVTKFVDCLFCFSTIDSQVTLLELSPIVFLIGSISCSFNDNIAAIPQVIIRLAHFRIDVVNG